MWYLIAQTAVFILVAGLIGIWLGWYLGKLAREPEIDHLNNRLRSHRRDEGAATDRATEAERRSAELTGRLAEQESANRELAERIEQLEEQLRVCTVNQHDCQAARSDLESETARLQDALRRLSPRPEAAADLQPASAPPAGDPEPADDLKKIKGIGPRIAGLLEELGITRYRQIAELDAEAIARINDRLRFRGRIEREQWVEQARRLVGGD
jgi:predicted flap endonuclease-1-like 5' DNA nuclease